MKSLVYTVFFPLNILLETTVHHEGNPSDVSRHDWRRALNAKLIHLRSFDRKVQHRPIWVVRSSDPGYQTVKNCRENHLDICLLEIFLVCQRMIAATYQT